MNKLKIDIVGALNGRKTRAARYRRVLDKVFKIEYITGALLWGMGAYGFVTLLLAYISPWISLTVIFLTVAAAYLFRDGNDTEVEKDSLEDKLLTLLENED